MVVSKLDIELSRGRSFKVKIVKMQDDLKSDYSAHQVCSSDGFKIARKNICTNPECKFHAEFPSSEDTKRTFLTLKNGEKADKKDIYEKVINNIFIYV